MVSYHYWKVDGKKIENLEIPDMLDAHIDVGKPIRVTYQPGKDNVNRIWAIQVEESQSVRLSPSPSSWCRWCGSAFFP